MNVFSIFPIYNMNSSPVKIFQPEGKCNLLILVPDCTNNLKHSCGALSRNETSAFLLYLGFDKVMKNV